MKEPAKRQHGRERYSRTTGEASVLQTAITGRS